MPLLKQPNQRPNKSKLLTRFHLLFPDIFPGPGPLSGFSVLGVVTTSHTPLSAEALKASQEQEGYLLFPRNPLPPVQSWQLADVPR